MESTIYLIKIRLIHFLGSMGRYKFLTQRLKILIDEVKQEFYITEILLIKNIFNGFIDRFQKQLAIHYHHHLDFHCL